MIRVESMTINSVAMRRNVLFDIILCDGNYGVDAFGMKWEHNTEPERSRVTS